MPRQRSQMWDMRVRLCGRSNVIAKKGPIICGRRLTIPIGVLERLHSTNYKERQYNHG